MMTNFTRALHRTSKIFLKLVGSYTRDISRAHLREMTPRPEPSVCYAHNALQLYILCSASLPYHANMPRVVIRIVYTTALAAAIVPGQSAVI